MTEPTQRKKVMIVDDSEIVLAVAQNALESVGFEVVVHPRPAGCIALVLQEAPDLLLIDVNMPGLNGDTLVKMLGATQANAQMIILLFSSLSADILAEKATASRAHGYIRKSESPTDLVRQVSRWIRPGSGSGAYQFGSNATLAREGSDSRLRIAAAEAPLARDGSVSRMGIAVAENGVVRDGSDSRLKIPAVGASAARDVSNSQLRMTAAATARSKSSGRILLVDHEMVTLSEFRRLVMSHPGPVEFALSGSEVLRRLQSECPPDVVVLGTLVGSPSAEELLSQASRLSPRWTTRFIVIHDGATDPRTYLLGNTRLRRPITEASLCDAISDCLQYAS